MARIWNFFLLNGWYLVEDFNKSFSKIIKRKVISQKTSESRWMGSESPEMTRKRYRSAADCAMRKEKDINYVARRRNEITVLFLLVIRLTAKRCIIHSPCSRLRLTLKYMLVHSTVKVHTCVYDKTWYVIVSQVLTALTIVPHINLLAHVHPNFLIHALSRCNANNCIIADVKADFRCKLNNQLLLIY